LLRFLIYLAMSWAIPSLAAPPVATTRPATGAALSETLAEYVRQSGGRYAYGLYVGEQKVGWTIDEMRLGELDGKPAAVSESEGRMEMLIMGNKATFQWHNRTHYELRGDGSVLRIEELIEEDGKPKRIVAQRDPDGLKIRTEAAGRVTERQVPLPKQTLKTIEELDRWLTTVVKAGDEFRSYSIGLDSEDIDRLEAYTYLGRRPFRWRGVATELIHVQLKTDGAVYQVDALPNGTAIKGKLGPFDMRMEEEAVARNLKAPVIDMTFEVPVSVQLGDPRRVLALTMEVSGIGDFNIPETTTQSVGPADGGAARQVRIVRQPLPRKPMPLTADEKSRALAATLSVQSGDPAIKKLAAQIVGDAVEPRAKAERINRWVYAQLKKSYQDNASTALEVLENKAGDCTEHTLLFIALCRAVGVPARELGGLAYDESQVVAAARRAGRQGGTFNWHAWGEIHDGATWISMDPTWNEVEVDATHLVLAIGPEDFAWVNILGKMKLSVVEFSTQ